MSKAAWFACGAVFSGPVPTAFHRAVTRRVHRIELAIEKSGTEILLPADFVESTLCIESRTWRLKRTKAGGLVLI